MERALLLAGRARGRTTPNPLVGAVVVTPDGVVAGAGYHERAGEPHAEVHALREAGEAARGATLYCTLEPCSHVGRTPPCVDRILDAGVARVVAAVEDPNPLVAGRGFLRLRQAGVIVDVGAGERGGAAAQPPVLQRDAARPAVRHRQGRHQPRRTGRGCRRRSHAAQFSCDRSPHARAARRGRCDRRRLGHDARRRSAADGARRLPKPAAHPRDLRPPVEDAAPRRESSRRSTRVRLSSWPVPERPLTRRARSSPPGLRW